MPDENGNDESLSHNDIDAAANRGASDGLGQAEQPKPDEEGSGLAAPNTAAAGEPDGSSDESDSSSATAGALSQEDVDAAFADAGIDGPTSQAATQPHDGLPSDETDASKAVDEQDLIHQADARALDMPDLESTQAAAEANAASIELLKDVELGVTIELGRCRMYVEDVLKLDQGAVVELDKLAGDPVDVYVNERLIARGEVLVLNDNFCVRINEIVASVQEAKTA